MRTDINTASISKHKSLTVWREAVCANLVGVECIPTRKDILKGRFTQMEYEGFAIARLRAEAHHAIRQNSILRKSDKDFYMLFLQKSGTMRVKRDKRDFVVHPGDMYFYDGATEHHLMFDDPFDHLAVKVPRKVLESRWPNLADAGSFRLRANDSMIDRILLPMAGAALGATNLRELPAVAKSVIELFTIRLEQADPNEASGSDYARLLLAKVKKILEEHLEDFELSASSVAQEFRISRRQLDRVLAQCGTSFSKLLTTMRLNRAAELLENPVSKGHSITRIALEVGFENHSFFSRKFRAHFDESPRDYRFGKQNIIVSSRVQ